MSEFRKFKTRPGNKLETDDQYIQRILDLVKKEQTYIALDLALCSMTKQQMVDFALNEVSKKYRMYTLGISKLKTAVNNHRQGDLTALSRWMEEQKTGNFTFSPFANATYPIVKTENAKSSDTKFFINDILMSLMSDPKMDYQATDYNDPLYKDFQLRLISNILSVRFNNNTMKVLYGF